MARRPRSTGSIGTHDGLNLSLIDILRNQESQTVKITSTPWGLEYIYAHGDGYIGKILHIFRGNRTSLQFHRKKHETIFVAAGMLTAFIDGEEKVLQANDRIVIPPKTKHRLCAIYDDAILLEASTDHLDDVVRLEDDYGRVD